MCINIGAYYKGKFLGDIQYLPIKGGSVGKSELYDSDVYYGKIKRVCDDDLLYYLKNYEDGQGDLYVKKHMVDSDVYNMLYIKESGKLYYAKSDEDTQNGKLKVYSKGKTIEIDEDVYAYLIMETGNSLYEKNTGEGLDVGDLYFWNGKNSVLVAEDVAECVSIDPNLIIQGYDWLWGYYSLVASSLAPW